MEVVGFGDTVRVIVAFIFRSRGGGGQEARTGNVREWVGVLGERGASDSDCQSSSSRLRAEGQLHSSNVSRPGIWDLLSQPFAGRVDGLPDNSPSSPTRGPQGPSFDSLVHYFL